MYTFYVKFLAFTMFMLVTGLLMYKDKKKGLIFSVISSSLYLLINLAF